jgi:quercetin dioxygenase-like cupin family protein
MQLSRGGAFIRQPRELIMTKIILVVAISAASILLTAANTRAQQPPVKRTIVQTVDFPPGLTTVTYVAEIIPGGCSGRHSHPSVETSYVIEGTMLVKVAGKPDQTLKAGDSSQTPAGTVHEVCAGPGQVLKIISNQVVGKDAPLASPAP